MSLFNIKRLDSVNDKDEEKRQLKYLLEKMDKQPLENDEYRYLQFLLMKHEILYRSNCLSALPYPLCKIGVTSDKIMFISDTHRGNSKIESKQLIDIAYNEALRQNIKAVVHAGDFTEATPVEHYKEYEVVLKELEKAISDLPNELTTGLLLGNHDYAAIRSYSEIIPYYFNIPQLEILGMQKVLLYWNKQAIIRVEHPISQLKEPKEENHREIITLEGHHHSYGFKEDFRTICLPSLSKATPQVYDPTLYSKGINLCSLFVIAENQGDTLQFKYCKDPGLKGQLKVSEIVEVNTKTKQLKLYH